MLKARLRVPNTGEIIHPETNADMILYSDTTVASVLSNAISKDIISDYMQEFLQSSTGDDLRRVLKIYREPLYDECLLRWTRVGHPECSTNMAKFNNALQTTPNAYAYRENFIFGGADFTIDFWGYMLNLTPEWGAIFGTNCTGYEGAIYLTRYGSTSTLNLGVYDSSAQSQLESDNVQLSVNPINFLRHYEIDYNHQLQTLKVFIDGLLVYSKSEIQIERLNRACGLGVVTTDQNRTCYSAISEFRISDGICRHEENFSPPEEPYKLDEYTISLLHFD